MMSSEFYDELGCWYHEANKQWLAEEQASFGNGLTGAKRNEALAAAGFVNLHSLVLSMRLMQVSLRLTAVNLWESG